MLIDDRVSVSLFINTYACISLLSYDNKIDLHVVSLDQDRFKCVTIKNSLADALFKREHVDVISYILQFVDQ